MKKSAKKKSNERKVWRIFRFARRYELRDDERKCRRSGLMFTRDFVSAAAGDEAAGYYLQLGMLDNGDGESFCLLFGLYRRLVNEAGKRSRAYRGYLIDADEQPLSDAAIGRLLKINPKRISTLLHKLEVVKLLEHVTMPDKFDKSLNEIPTHSGGKGQKKSAGSGGGRKRAGISARGRSGAEVSARVRRPLKKTKTETATATRNTNSTSKKISNGQFDNGNPQREINNGSGNRIDEVSALERERKSNNEDQPLPTKPRGSAGSGGRIVSFPVPPPVANPNRNQPQRLGDIISGIEHRWDPDAKQFGCDIYRALELNFEPTSKRGRRELGSFASVWEKAKVGLTPVVLAELRRRAVLEAGKLAKRKSQCKNRSAVFCHIFARLVNAAGVTARTDRGVG